MPVIVLNRWARPLGFPYLTPETRRFNAGLFGHCQKRPNPNRLRIRLESIACVIGSASDLKIGAFRFRRLVPAGWMARFEFESEPGPPANHKGNS